MTKKHTLKSLVCVLLCLAQIAIFPTPAGAAAKTIQIAQVQRMALSRSTDLTKTYNEILLKKMKYTEAVNGIKAKVKSLTSFRWTPLLSFKFPQKLNMSQEYDLNIKPLNLQTDIRTLQHKMDKQKYEVLGKANKAYLDTFINQEKASFTQERLTAAQNELSRNQARLQAGLATQTDVDSMSKTVDSLTTSLAQQKRALQTSAQTLSDLIKLDVTTGYTFKNPLRDADIPRSDLEKIITSTLENNQTYYETKMATSTAKLNLDSYESLFRNQYGSKVDPINGFIEAAKRGEDVDYAAFQLKYSEMLKTFDKPWVGYIRIIFFKFVKEWFKGDIDGTRYVEDDMNALMTACKEYSNAIAEQKSMEKSMRQQVSSSYEALISARNAYRQLEKTRETTKTDLQRLSELNKLGKAEYSEVKDKQDDYQSIQLDALDALSSYNELLYEFDVLTCGAITKYLSGASYSTDTGSGADSYLTNGTNIPYYYIYTDVANLVFVFGLDIPKDFEPQITDYEIWYEGTQIGARTKADQQLRHLALDYQGSSTLTVRLYGDDKFLGECEIDTTVPRDVLSIKGTEPAAVAAEKQGGTYTVTTTAHGSLSTSTLKLSFNAPLGVAYYKLENSSGTSVYTADPISAEETFSYLTLLVSSLSSVKIQLFDKDKKEIGTGRFDEDNQTIMVTIQ